MDHSHDHAAVDGPWAAGWAIAVAAGGFAVAVARLMGQADMTASALVGVVVFAVFGVLLGSGGVELTAAGDHGDDHGAGGHH